MPRIGARFGLERRFDRSEPRAESGKHLLEHMIEGEPKIAFANFDGNMPVAEMIRGT